MKDENVEQYQASMQKARKRSLEIIEADTAWTKVDMKAMDTTQQINHIYKRARLALELSEQLVILGNFSGSNQALEQLELIIKPIQEANDMAGNSMNDLIKVIKPGNYEA